MSFSPHQPYEQQLGHPSDFRVRYRFFTPAEGGLSRPVYQGLRADFRYADSARFGQATWMIWPEFEDEHGNVRPTTTGPVALAGTARMWIVNPAQRPLHRARLALGTRAYLLNGGPVAEYEVIEITGLWTNPGA